MRAPLKPRSRPSPEEAVKIAAQAAPELPPARLEAADKAIPFSTKLRASTLDALDARAKAEGVSMKAIICRALAAAGVEVAPADLEDRTPRRRGAA